MPVRCETPFSSAAAAEKGGIPSKNMFVPIQTNDCNMFNIPQIKNKSFTRMSQSSFLLIKIKYFPISCFTRIILNSFLLSVYPVGKFVKMDFTRSAPSLIKYHLPRLT